jgi:choloylglycine hydrolase
MLYCINANLFLQNQKYILNEIEEKMMCTAISYRANGHYFGRNLDIEAFHEENIAITPRHVPLLFRNGTSIDKHFSVIGMAHIENGNPLYYDATNEKGLSVAALSFPHEAHYQPTNTELINLAPWEIIPFVLCQCETAAQAKNLLSKVNITKEKYREDFPLTPLHFLIADNRESFVAEPIKSGLAIHDNPLGILTNSPRFEFQMQHLNLFMGLSNKPVENRFSKEIPFTEISRGMGALGLPGDLSSTSRFVRAAFIKFHSQKGIDEAHDIRQFFHILSSVEQQKGCVDLNGEMEFTAYSSCCDTENGIYYYKTYDNFSIIGIDMRKEDLNGTQLIAYPIIRESRFAILNQPR